MRAGARRGGEAIDRCGRDERVEPAGRSAESQAARSRAERGRGARARPCRAPAATRRERDGARRGDDGAEPAVRRDGPRPVARRGGARDRGARDGRAPDARARDGRARCRGARGARGARPRGGGPGRAGRGPRAGPARSLPGKLGHRTRACAPWGHHPRCPAARQASETTASRSRPARQKPQRCFRSIQSREAGVCPGVECWSRATGAGPIAPGRPVAARVPSAGAACWPARLPSCGCWASSWSPACTSLCTIAWPATITPTRMSDAQVDGHGPFRGQIQTGRGDRGDHGHAHAHGRDADHAHELAARTAATRDEGAAAPIDSRSRPAAPERDRDPGHGAGSLAHRGLAAVDPPPPARLPALFPADTSPRPLEPTDAPRPSGPLTVRGRGPPAAHA